ncbi:MAG: hypothetical protein BVN35_02780 [Proteobacteria bacterium ST_bin11]|nr:MAG: hypothetical protein BVN35_02780 [Proteobacteria bacterium ST_bin11]
MINELFSPHWYRVAKLKPKLHSHIEIHRHEYRGLIWYILEDPNTARHQRFNSFAYQFIGLLDGKLTVQEIADALNRQLGDFAPSQQDLIQLLGQLHQADLIQTEALVNSEELFERQARLNSAKTNQRLLNPLSLRLPLWDPDEFLSKHLAKVAGLFSIKFGLVWLLALATALLQTGENWPAISHHFELNALAPYNFLIMFLLYPFIKILHELGHGFAMKLKGGEVHEMGVNFLLFMPVPYVNVSNANHLRNKYDRILISAAGILVECFLAALGLLLFLSSEAGLVQDLGFNIMLTGGVSSLFFNGNPLLKYDGYYILADALSIPNLYQRSSQIWAYFCQRYLFDLKQAVSPASAPGETAWFVIYSLASLSYRLVMLWFVCIYLTEKFFSLGVIVALLMVTTQIVLPVYKAIRFVLSNPILGRKRQKALLTTAGVAVSLILLLGVLPIPHYTLAEGVVWLPDEAQIKVEQEGFVGDLLVKSNQFVQQGDVLLTMHDDALETKAKIARAKVAELQSQYRAEKESDLVKAEILKESLHVAESELDHLHKKANAMTISAAKSGYILLPDADDLTDSYLRQGELIGYIMDQQPPTIRMVVTQDDIGLLREHIAEVSVRLVSDPYRDYPASIIRLAPEATNTLPSPALATTGGGNIRVNSENEQDMQTLQKIFLVDLDFSPPSNLPIGVRAYVRINHGGESIMTQVYRRVRQVFLRQFNV